MSDETVKALRALWRELKPLAVSAEGFSDHGLPQAGRIFDSHIAAAEQRAEAERGEYVDYGDESLTVVTDGKDPSRVLLRHTVRDDEKSSRASTLRIPLTLWQATRHAPARALLARLVEWCDRVGTDTHPMPADPYEAVDSVAAEARRLAGGDLPRIVAYDGNSGPGRYKPHDGRPVLVLPTEDKP